MNDRYLRRIRDAQSCSECWICFAALAAVLATLAWRIEAGLTLFGVGAALAWGWMDWTADAIRREEHAERQRVGAELDRLESAARR